MIGETTLARNHNKYTEVLIVTEILHRGNFDSKMSVARIEIDGKNRKVRNQEADALYIIVAAEGECQFTLYGETEAENKIIKVKSGNSVFVPKGSWYRDEGKMTMYSIYQPAFDSAKVEVAVTE